MITLTREAAEVLERVLKERGIGPDRGLRISLAGEEWDLNMGAAQPGDRVLRLGATAVVFISPKADTQAGEAVLTVDRHDGEGTDLVLRRETQPQVVVPEEAHKGPIDPGTPPVTPQKQPTSGE